MSELGLSENEAIIRKLVEASHSALTEDELAKVRKGLAMYESLGVLSNVVIKAAAMFTALGLFYQYVIGRGH